MASGSTLLDTQRLLAGVCSSSAFILGFSLLSRGILVRTLRYLVLLTVCVCVCVCVFV